MSAILAELSLQEQYFGINVLYGDVSTMLPDDGSVQAVRMQGKGTQIYECQQAINSKDRSRCFLIFLLRVARFILGV
jgi:hypothetical protein